MHDNYDNTIGCTNEQMKEAFRKRGMDMTGERMGVDSMIVEHIGTLGTKLTGYSCADTMISQSPLVQLKLFPKLSG
jgi:hypothetical protein